ncbi:MAG: DUF3305 domain-containing protein [Candidatus Parcubacteria bacterium]|nr:DUF3305 domain-containing protein [Burkholderiales bacterium]
MEKPKKTLAVIMQRRSLGDRWGSVSWEAWSVLESAEPQGEPRMLVEQENAAQWLFSGFDLLLHRDEAEGYYLNVSTSEPSVFVMSRMEEDKCVPQYVTVSYDEASRWMDGGAQVDRVAMSPALFAWVGGWVEENYRPEPRRRIKPRSFVSPKDRVN